MKMKFLGLTILLAGLLIPAMAEVKVEVAKILPIETGFNPIQKVGGFVITEDGLLIILDEWAGNFQLFEKKDEKFELVKVVGEKGYGYEGLVKPDICTYDKTSRRFIVADSELKALLIYNRLGKTHFMRDMFEVPCKGGAFDLQLVDNQLYISGLYKKVDDKGRSALYSINLDEIRGDEDNDQLKPRSLISSDEMYEIDNSKGYKNQYSDKFIPVIGQDYFFDIHDSFAYIAWTGDLKIRKISLDSTKSPENKMRMIIGKKTDNYVKPHPAQKLVRAYLSRNREQYLNEIKKVSLIWKVFTTNSHVCLIYGGPSDLFEKTNFWIQYYTFDGEFKGEEKLKGQPNRRFFFHKDSNMLYSMSGDLYGGSLSIIKYKIIE